MKTFANCGSSQTATGGMFPDRECSNESNLSNLDDDILSLIASHLLDSKAHSSALADVLSMSVLCRRLRRPILSLIFREVRWPQDSRIDFYPRSLWPYIRRLSFLQVQWISRHTKALDTLADILPQLTNITVFNYCPQSFPPNLDFISALASFSSSLTALELTTVFMYRDAVALFSQFSELHRLVLKQPEGSTLLSASESRRAQSIQCVANLLFACHSTLNHVELPGEFCPLESFAHNVALFPALKTFILRGYPPLDAENFPMWKVLQSMPRLSRLEVSCRLRVIGANVRRYAIMPQDASPAPGEVFLFPSELETLSLSNPSLKDRIFQQLPLSLKYLLLDFTPDWENMLSSKDSLAYHRPTEMLAFFLTMQESNKPSRMTCLEELRIKMGWCATPEILGCISHIFPNLKVLELQGLRYVDRATEPESDMDSCIEGMSGLHHLRTLKLAMELRENSYEYSRDRVRNVGSIDQSTQIWADALAHRLPNLQLVAFETRPHTGRGLGPRILIGRPSWAWFSAGEHGVMNRIDEPLEQRSEIVREHDSRWGLPQAPTWYQPRRDIQELHITF